MQNQATKPIADELVQTHAFYDDDHRLRIRVTLVSPLGGGTNITFIVLGNDSDYSHDNTRQRVRQWLRDWGFAT